ncbi:RNA-directed DNA polymerase, eukaryota, reverse transcriptase zinc-binding domain protein [Tanacetum coccineum]
MEYLRSGNLEEKKYATSFTKPKAARYELYGIEEMIPNLWSPYKVAYDKDVAYGISHWEIIVKRENQKEYLLKETDFPRLHLHDIEDMFLLYLQNKLHHLKGDVQTDLVVALQFFIRITVLKHRVEDVQLGVESYQTKINLTRPQVLATGVDSKELYTIFYKPKGVIYESSNGKKCPMREDEVYKFRDATIMKVRDELKYQLHNFRLGYNEDMLTRPCVQDEAYQGRLFDNFQDEGKYEHAGLKVTRLQDNEEIMWSSLKRLTKTSQDVPSRLLCQGIGQSRIADRRGEPAPTSHFVGTNEALNGLGYNLNPKQLEPITHCLKEPLPRTTDVNSSEMSEELKARIESNRLKALERVVARKRALETEASKAIRATAIHVVNNLSDDATTKFPKATQMAEGGGLNIGSLKAFNLAFLQKWRWRLYSSPNALWVKIIKALHEQEGGFDNHGCKFNSTWARIVGSSNYLHSKDIIPLNSFRFQARLYRLEHDKDCLIINRIDNGPWSWNWSRTDIGVRNTAYLSDMFLEISLVDTHAVEDYCLCSMLNDGLFSIEVARRIIDSKLLPSLVPSTSWDKILPRKVNIFIWGLSLDRLSHRLNLSSRGIAIPKISCSSYNGNMESSNHVFFACDISMEVWRLVRN